jgi:hypothetical protein
MLEASKPTRKRTPLSFMEPVCEYQVSIAHLRNGAPVVKATPDYSRFFLSSFVAGLVAVLVFIA